MPEVPVPNTTQILDGTAVRPTAAPVTSGPTPVNFPSVPVPPEDPANTSVKPT